MRARLNWRPPAHPESASHTRSRALPLRGRPRCSPSQRPRSRPSQRTSARRQKAHHRAASSAPSRPEPLPARPSTLRQPTRPRARAGGPSWPSSQLSAAPTLSLVPLHPKRPTAG
eukprot:scaffold80429_cov31-Tisochrysis_lutea.AAC.4